MVYMVQFGSELCIHVIVSQDLEYILGEFCNSVDVLITVLYWHVKDCDVTLMQINMNRELVSL